MPRRAVAVLEADAVTLSEVVRAVIVSLLVIEIAVAIGLAVT